MKVDPTPNSDGDRASSAPRALRGRALHEAMVVLGYPEGPPGEALASPASVPPSAPSSPALAADDDGAPSSSEAPRALQGEALRRVLESLAR
jgi:hypothetical protein